MDRIPPPELPPTAEPGERAPTSRRHVLKAGLTAAPVLLTLRSRPVLGGACVSASAMGSGNTSVVGATSTCSGIQPSAWVKTKDWQASPYYSGWQSTATPYHCSTTKLGGTTFSSNTMMYVMKNASDSNMYTLGAYIAAALLNARRGLTPVLSEATVQSMWNDYLLNGYFAPVPGIQWSATDIIAYIKTTMV